MVVLFTNIGFARRTGTEVLTADLTRELQARGHLPMVYSPTLGEVAEQIAARGIAVTSNLSALPRRPDVIHGHHHIETVEAMQAFPKTPALFVCHDATAWHDQVPHHRNLVEFVAVGLNAKRRLLRDWSKTRGRVSVIGNGVDLRRFRRVRVLSKKPERALVFSNDAGDGSHWEPIRRACARVGLAVDRVGPASGNQTRTPEEVLGKYDLVFAKGRCALEAAASGCAVVLCDVQGLGTMVSASRVEKLVAWNFGMRTMPRELDERLIEEEIRRYDAADAARVCEFVRANATLEIAVDRYVALYRRVMGARIPAEDGSGDERYPVTRRLEIGDQAGLDLAVVEGSREVKAGQAVELRVRLTNKSNPVVGTSPPWPALLFHRWYAGESREPMPVETPRSILQPPLWRGCTGEYKVRAVAPWRAGRYRLEVTIIQENWRWLDELEPRVRAEWWLDVVEPCGAGRLECTGQETASGHGGVAEGSATR